MPFRGYFLYIGSVLIALLFILNWYLPPPEVGATRSDVDRSIIRIHSAHKWPQAVVIDTTLPTIVPPQAAAVAAAALAAPSPKPPREAYAMAEATPAAKPAEAAKPGKPHVRRARVARAPGSRVASYDMFGSRNESFGFRNDFFGSRSSWPASW